MVSIGKRADVVIQRPFSSTARTNFKPSKNGVLHARAPVYPKIIGQSEDYYDID